MGKNWHAFFEKSFGEQTAIPVKLDRVAE